MSFDLNSALAHAHIFLARETIERQKLFLDELLRWNKRFNLTAIRSREEGQEKHLLDSLLILPYLVGCSSLLDMGSGAGLPGIPLAIARPDLQVVSIDSVGKKINFQKHIKRKLQLTNLQAQVGRLEEISIQSKFDAVIARALAPLGRLLFFAEGLLEGNGRFFAMKGPEGESEWSDLSSAPARPAFELLELAKYRLPSSGAERQLLIFKKNTI